MNVPLDVLPSWLATAGKALPLTHGIEAVREMATGRTPAAVAGMLAVETVVGACYGVLGFGLLALFKLIGTIDGWAATGIGHTSERQSRMWAELVLERGRVVEPR